MHSAVTIPLFDMLDQEDLQTLPEAFSLMCIHEGPNEIEMQMMQHSFDFFS